MSNWKRAYGWSGHIIASDFDTRPNPDHNLIVVPRSIFRRLEEDYDSARLDPRIHVERLGVLDPDPTELLACGTSFSQGFTHYGTVFLEAEIRAEGGKPNIDRDAEYLAAMKEIYGIDLPPCRLMVGCSSEK